MKWKVLVKHRKLHLDQHPSCHVLQGPLKHKDFPRWGQDHRLSSISQDSHLTRPRRESKWRLLDRQTSVCITGTPSMDKMNLRLAILMTTNWSHSQRSSSSKPRKTWELEKEVLSIHTRDHRFHPTSLINNTCQFARTMPTPWWLTMALIESHAAVSTTDDWQEIVTTLSL